MIRGALVSSIYSRVTETGLTALEDCGAVTLMSTDVERITNGIIVMHEVWANLIEIGLATYFLAAQIGVACIVAIIVAFGEPLIFAISLN